MKSSLRASRAAENGNNERIEAFKRQIMELQTENEKLRRGVDDIQIQHHHALASREETIRQLQASQYVPSHEEPRESDLLRRENDAHKLEINQLRDRLTDVTGECDALL